MRRRRHQAALGRLDDGEMAGAAGLARDAVIGRIDEADELRRLAVEQRVAVARGLALDGQFHALG